MAYLTRAWARRTFLVDVAGLPQIFCTSPNPTLTGLASAYMAGTGTAVPRVAKAVVQNLSDWAWEVDPAGGICAYEPLDVTLYTEGPLRRRADDPGIIFDRNGENRAAWWAKVLADIEADEATPDIVVDRAAPVGWTYPRLIHLDGETFLVSAFDGDGTEGDPYTFTTTARAVGDTRQSRHLVEDGTAPPLVTDEVVWWSGRRVRVLIAERFERGHGRWVELFHGVLDAAPQITGHKVVLRVLPLTTLLDVELGEEAESEPIRLVHGYHAFDDGYCSYVEHGQTVDYRLGVAVNEVYLAQAHIVQDGDPDFVILRWPGEVVERVNAAWAAAADTAEYLPLVASISVGADLAVTFRRRAGEDDIGGRVFFYSTEHIVQRFSVPWVSADDRGPVSEANRCLALDFARPESTDYPSRESGVLRLPLQPGPPGYARRYGVAVGEWIRGLDSNPRYWEDAAPDRVQRVQCRSVPLAWRGQSERHLLVTRHLSIPEGGSVSVRISYYSLWRDEVDEVVCRITDSEGVTLPDGAGTAWRWTIAVEDAAAVPELWDLPDMPQVTITPAILFRGRPPGRILLELVESGTGGQINGTHDVHPYGAGIPAALVDEGSFDQLQPVSNADAWTDALPAGAKLSKLANGLLQALGGILALRTSPRDGRCRLTVVPLHPPSVTSALGEVAAGDFLVAAQAEGNPDPRLVNRVKVLALTRGGVEHPAIFRDNRSINRMSGETRTMEVDLRATQPLTDENSTTEAFTRFRTTAGRIFAALSRPRELWEGTVVAGPMLFAQPAGVYLFTSPRLRSPASAEYGVVREPGRLLSAKIALMGPGAQVSAVAYGLNPQGWGPSCEVVDEDADGDNVVLTVAENAYSNPAGGDLDIDGFEVGDPVWVEPEGDDDNGLNRVILALDRATPSMTVEGPSGLSSPHWGGIVPREYDAAAEHHQPYAHLADADGVVGGDDAPGTTLV